MSQVLTLTELGTAGVDLSDKVYDFGSTVLLRGLRKCLKGSRWERKQQLMNQAWASSTLMPLVPGFQQTGPALMLIPNSIRAKFTFELLQREQSLLNGTFNLVLLLLPSKVYKEIEKKWDGVKMSVCKSHLSH